MYKALVVDDHPFIRATVKMLLAQEGFEVVGEADNGVEAVQMARELSPELILLDISMSLLDGIEVINRLVALKLSTRILVLTSQTPEIYAERCLRAGASGYLSKTEDLGELVRGVHAVMAGQKFFPFLASSSVRGIDNQATDLQLIERLSNRELTILKQLALGKSNNEIADQMLLSNKTISTYKTRVLEKLSLTSVVYIAEFAKRNHLV